MHPNAHTCIHTGKEAFAQLGLPVRGMVTGWYGSTVVDGLSPLVALDPDLPEGPVCDEMLEIWLAEGKVVDPSDFTSYRADVVKAAPETVSAILDLGARLALHYLDSEPTKRLPFGMPTFPGNEYLAFPFIQHLTGKPIAGSGPDLLAIGRLMAIVSRARGRAFDADERRVAIAEFVDSLHMDRQAMMGILSLADDLEEMPSGPPAPTSGRPHWLRGVVEDGVVPEGLAVERQPADRLRALAQAGRFEELGRELASVDVGKTPAMTLVAYARAVEHVADEVPDWSEFVSRVSDILEVEGLDAETILAGLIDGASPRPR